MTDDIERVVHYALGMVCGLAGACLILGLLYVRTLDQRNTCRATVEAR